VTARARSALLAGIALASAVLFILYLGQSRSVVVGSDGGSIALQAWDMLHGNLLLHGWAMSDVSFYPTELPQYALLEWARGLSPDVVHVAGAMTYTLVLLLAGLVAKGSATGREAVLRVVIAIAIMLAPAAGYGTSTLLLTPDHLGSTVPVLLAWLVVDRCQPRWYVPVSAGLLLTWGLVADALLEVTAVAPLVLLCAIRAAQRVHPAAPAGRRPPLRVPARKLTGRTGPPGLPAGSATVGSATARSLAVAVRTSPAEPARGAVDSPRWFELGLAAAALAAIGAAALVSAFIRASGGFALRPVGTRFAGFAALPHNVRLTAQGIGMLFGASFGRGQPVNLIFSSLHLVSVALVAVAFCIAGRRFLRREEFLVPALALAIVLNVILYAHGRYVQDLLSTREITEVLPLGAVLAGRVMAHPVLAARIRGKNALMLPLGVVLAGYAVVLGVYAAQPPVPAEHQDLAGWLVAHHLTGGLAADYWLANSLTVDSGGQAEVRQVSIRNRVVTVPDSGWGFARQWYRPAGHDADFVVTDDAPGTAAWHSLLNSARNTFGPPARTYSYRQYTVLVWGANLLTRLGPAGG
jgi:hypothetical protein